MRHALFAADVPAYWKSGYQVFNPKLVQGALAASFPNHFSAPEGYVKPTTHFEERAARGKHE
jgi:hypothetical protein